MVGIAEKKTTIKKRMLRVIAFSLAIAIFTSASILSVFAVRNAKTNLIEDITIIGEIVANRGAGAAMFSDQTRALENLTPTKYHKDIDYICQYDSFGNLFVSLSHNDHKNECKPTHDTPIEITISDTPQELKIEIPILHEGEPLGHLEFFSDKKSVFQAIILFASTLVGTLLIALLIAYIFGTRLVSATLLPLKRLYETSQQIARSPYSSIRAEKTSHDEIGNLVDVFNQILDNLENDNEALTNSEARFRVLAEHAPIGIFLKNASLEFEYTNERWSEITGLSDRESFAFVNNIEVKDTELYQSLQSRARTHHTPQVIEYSYTTPLGNRRTLMEHIAPLSDHEGFSGFVGSLLDVTELKNAQVELEKLAFYDPLTELPNRRFFRGHLELSIESAKKHDAKLAVLMIDLDNFKKVNDTLGHDAGDKLLMTVGQRLKTCLSSVDVVSRMGGDEFMILIKQAESSSQLDYKASRILQILNEKTDIDGQPMEISGSIGIAIYPSDANSYEELVRFADIALYNAKDQGGNIISYYSCDLDKLIKEKMRLEQKLRAAIENNLLEVYVQPIYETATQTIYKGEALARWFDEEEGFIPPDKFIPLAEESGLIFDIGRIVIEKVFAFISSNGESLKEMGVNSIAINLSARQFFSNPLVPFVKNMLTHYNVDPHTVEFELTESMVMDDVDKAISIMRAIRQLGCKLSIDDFGTGYSSLAYLKQFPVDNLKIDRSFVKDIPNDNNDIEISCSIIAMGHKLGLQVIAEGVETVEQFNLLKQEKCDYIQGYYFAKPMPMDHLLRKKKPISVNE